MQRRDFLPAALLAAAGVAAYLNSLSAPFLFDDFYHIVQNPHIRDLLQPVHVLGGTARPLTALTLALNYALGGLDVRGYHAFNLTVHLLAGLALLGILRRTFRSNRLRAQTGAQATELALAASLIWLLHPVQTQSVTYVIQRSESLMGLFYLLTLYCVIRGWPGRAILCCALGMLTKPVMVTAPLVILLYDRVFLSSSWRDLFHRRWRLYAGLAATWAILPAVILQGGPEYRGLVGVNKQGISPVSYLLTQSQVILHYLRLSFWPDPLLLDYQWPIVKSLGGAALPAAIVAGGLTWTLLALRRRPEIGFLGVWFFLILAPTSSFLPIVDAAFDHRMYLPLAAVVLLFLAGLKRLTGPRTLLFRATLCALILLLTTATLRRNELYNRPVEFWEQHVSYRPGSARARVNLGAALQAAGRPAEAIAQFRSAAALQPDSHDAHNNLGALLLQQNQTEEAFQHYREALRLAPDFAMAHQGMGRTLERMGRLEEAAEEYEKALRLNPALSDSRVQLGLIRQAQGRQEEAFQHYREALRVNPEEPAAYNNIGTLLFQRGKWRESVEFFQRALELRPDYREAGDNLRKARRQLERTRNSPKNNPGSPP